MLDVRRELFNAKMRKKNPLEYILKKDLSGNHQSY